MFRRVLAAAPVLLLRLRLLLVARVGHRAEVPLAAITLPVALAGPRFPLVLLLLLLERQLVLGRGGRLQSGWKKRNTNLAL